MTATVIPVSGNVSPRTPRARCQFCGKVEVVALCCHCTAFLCGSHQRQADLDQARSHARSLLRRGVHRDAAPDVIDRVPAPHDHPEPVHPLLDGDHEPRRDDEPDEVRAPAEPKSAKLRYFCPDCVPLVHRYDAQVLGSLVAMAVGAALVLLSALVGVLVLAVAAAWLATRIGTGFSRRRRRGRVNRGLLYLTPRIRKVELTETLTGRCLLDADRRETLTVDDISGVIDVGLRWTGNHAVEAERYRRRTRPHQQADLRVEAGYLVLLGAGQLDLRHPPGCEVTHAARVGLRPYLTDQGMLSSAEGRGDARWDFALSYRPTLPDGGRRLRVWVTPSFTPDSGRRALDLRVQWRTVDSIESPVDGRALTAKQLTRLVLEVPGAWGAVREATVEDVEQVLLGQAEDGGTRIEWKKPKIAGADRGARDLAVSFSRPIDPSSVVRGEIEIVFAETVSGITGVQLHAPGGGRRRDGARSKITTKMKVSFELSLNGIQHQESRTVPDATLDPDRSESRVFGTRPDQHLVVNLVRHLAEHGYLVKSVVEHPVRPGRGVGVQHRVWDVTGRRYRGVHPIDFRITVTGDDAESGSSSGSTTSIRLIVRGVHTSGVMAEQIVQAYDEIWARIDATVDNAGAGADGNVPRRQAEPLAAIGTHAANLRQTLVSIESIIDDAERFRGISTDVADQLRDAIETSRNETR